MFGSTVLEVAAGLTFCYASVALIVSTVQEALASALRLRAHTLLHKHQVDAGRSQFQCPGTRCTATRWSVRAPKQRHPFLYRAAQLRHRPDGIARGAARPGLSQIRQRIDALQDPQLRRALQGIWQRGR
ncbi:hypothetical protein LP419_21580 [Massilia sp. H-1]|nr:hypothetical protein LP419_21580 [Massilia sp. H-1]